MDKILLEGMRFYAFHGLEPQEERRGQVFVVDVELHLDLAPAGREDNLDRSVDYAQVYSLIRKTVEEERFALLEALAEALAARLLRAYPVQAVRVRVRKLRPPISGEYAYFGVEIWRQREG
ncbi:MAG: dihydroneopterin aldolase [Moorellales bacterium]